MAIFLFIVIFVSLCLFTQGSEEAQAPKIQPEMLLSRKGKPLYGAALEARIDKLIRQGYSL